MTRRGGLLLAILFCLSCLVTPLAANEGTELAIVNPGRISVAFDKEGTTYHEAQQLFPGAEILSGGFYSRDSLALAGLVIINGTCHHAPSAVANRPALGITKSGSAEITTAVKLFATRDRYKDAIECGPFLFTDGLPWQNFQDFDASFCRETGRVGIGLTKNGQTVVVRGNGTVHHFQKTAAAKVAADLDGDAIQVMMLLDGGTSLNPAQALPTRVIYHPSAEVARQP